ncbi:MAG: fumarylacetoacetate hydrolase family protein, partial [Deltaproteobacteria bacterium]|nr:fumarylacetoacetate hydrolase family protein [Deltaproteobacteria bacterium]
MRLCRYRPDEGEPFVDGVVTDDGRIQRRGKDGEGPSEPSEGWSVDAVELGVPTQPLRSFRDFYAFEAHVKTARARRGLEMVPEWYDFPVFYFSNAASIIGPGVPLLAPTLGAWLDFELEIGCVIGKAGRDIPAERAEDHVAGYTIINDWSLRDVQRQEMKVGLGPAKGKDFATSIGPYLVTPDDLADLRTDKGYDLAMVGRINGTEHSRGNWRDLHFSFGEMIARASQGVELQPGDLIGSGTVGTGCILELGVDQVGRWLAPGDVVELEVERLGVLRTP